MQKLKKLICMTSAIAIAGTCFSASFTASAAEDTNASNIDMAQKLSSYNVVFDSKGSSSKDSMPIGNGDMAANVWVEDNGDLMLYLSKGDSFSEATRLLKLGKLRIKLTPNPFASGKPFKQELSLIDGAIYVTAGEGSEQVTLKIWADANNPVIHVEAESESEIGVEVKAEPWRTTELEMNDTNKRSYIGVHINTAEPPKESADVYLNRPDSITWYHRNTTSMYQEMLDYQGLTGYEERYPDPYINNTFGMQVKADNMTSSDEYTLTSSTASTDFDLKLTAYTDQTDTVEEWENAINECLPADYDTDSAFAEHQKYWNDFWNKSWIFVSGDSDAENITRGYLLQRYMIACQGRADFPIKFNGGLFTMPDAEYGDDYRDWGSMYWHQNTRLVYWPMLASGDFDLLMPYFKMYKDQLPIRKEIAKQFFGCDGAYYPEQTYAYGADGTRDKMKWAIEGTAEYTTYHWQNGFEIVAMMLDYYDYTRDENFAKEYIVPIAQEVTRFYYQKYVKDGVMEISPSNALETYWNCTNPTDHIAGLRYIIPKLINLPKTVVTDELISEWNTCYDVLPPIPMSEDGTYIKPAQSYGSTKNVENPELYAVFPYKHYAIGSDTDINIGIKTFNKRIYKKDGCWYQDGIQAATLGLADEAKKNALYGLTCKAAGCKFPGFWAKGNDEVPDFDNGGQASLALQNMLMQTNNGKIYVLPAWPDGWDVDFKLTGSNNTDVHVVYENGNFVTAEISNPDTEVIFPAKEYDLTIAKPDTKVSLSDDCSNNGTNWTGNITAASDGDKSVYTQSTQKDASAIASTGDISMTDYTVSAKMKMSNLLNYFGGGIILRHIDDKNYVTFRLSGTSSSNMNADIIWFVDGTKAGTVSIPFAFDTSSYYELKATVAGNSVTGYINGEPVIENVEIPSELSHGNVGIRVYSGTIMLDDISVSQVSDKVYITSGKIVGNEINLSVANNNADTVDCVIAAAVYDENGILDNLKITPATLNKNSNTSIKASVDIGAELGNKTVKVMLLDKKDTLTPLTKAAYCGAESEQPAPTAPPSPSPSPTATPSSPSPTATSPALPTPSHSADVDVVTGNSISDMLYKTYSDDEYSHAISYRLYVPSDYDYTKKYPLLVYLNGAGSRGNDNEKQLSNLAPMLNPIIKNNTDYPCIIAVPQCPSSEQWVDTPWANGSYSQDNIPISDELAMVNGMIDELCGIYNVDTDRLYIAGQSMGGYGVWDMITRYPDKFASAVINCGAGDPSKASLIKDMPIMVLHGSADPTVPVSGSRDMVNALRSAGSDVLYYEFANNDHYVQRRMFENPSLWLNYLLSQTKGSPLSTKAPYNEYSLMTVNQFASAIPDTYKSNQSSSWSISTAGEGMLMGAAASNTSAVIYDSSTSDMSDYTASAYIKIPSGTNAGAGIVARYVDDSTLLTVRFTIDKTPNLQLVELQSGASSIIKNYPFEWNYDTLYNLKVEVKGSTLNAYVDNIPVITNYSINRQTLRTKGAAGLRVYSGTMYADDFAVYTTSPVNISSPEHSASVSSPYISLSGKTRNSSQAFDLYIDGKKASVTSDADCVWKFRTDKLENGAHQINVCEAGSSDVSDTHTIYVNNIYNAGITDYSVSFSEIAGTVENYTDTSINGYITAEYIKDGTKSDSIYKELAVNSNGTASFNIPIEWDLSAGEVKLYLSDSNKNAISEVINIEKQEIILTVNEFENYQVIQRDIGGTSKSVEISGIYDGINADVEAQITNEDNSEIIIPWTKLTRSEKEYSGNITLPQGGWYKLHIRAVNDNGTVKELNSQNKFGVGINILCIGQSNMVGTGALASNTSANTDGRTSYTVANDLAANFSNGSWKHLVDPYDNNAGSLVPSLANELTEKYNIPIGFVPAAASGAGLAVDPNNAWPNWITRNEDDHYKYDSLNIYGRSITRAKNAGGVELVIMNQGEHDVSMGTTKDVYESMLKQLHGYYKEDVYENIPLFICQLGASASTISAYQGKDDIMTGIRIAQSNCDNGKDFFLAATETDLSKNKDEIHYSVSSLDVIGERMANAIMYYFGDSNYYRGAYIDSASFKDSMDVIDVHITHRGGTDFTPASNITGFTVYDNGTEIPVKSAVKIDANTVRITLQAPVSGTGTLRYLYGKTPDISGIIKDNTPLKLPMEGTTEDIVIK